MQTILALICIALAIMAFDLNPLWGLAIWPIGLVLGDQA